jgi:hypothetical protein
VRVRGEVSWERSLLFFGRQDISLLFACRASEESIGGMVVLEEQQASCFWHVGSMINVSRRCVWLLVFSIACIITIGEYRSHFHGDVSLSRTSFDVNNHASAPRKYSKALVIGYREHRDNISWIDSLPADITRSIYVIGNKTASPTLPANKGREAMVYLTYIIDNYPLFPDVVMFFHPSDRAWHNNVLLGNSSLEATKRLSEARVLRDGYVNARCHWDPGCIGDGWLRFDVPGPPSPGRHCH